MRRHAAALLLLLPAAPLAAQQARLFQPESVNDRNVVVIVSDGLRWQEVFGGAADSLIDRRQGVLDTAGVRRRFGRADALAARRALMPFLWDSIAHMGQVFGNRALGGDAHVTNGLKFSYPGYNEMLTGSPDPRIDRNDAGPNPNLTVFEYLNGMEGFRGNVAAFATWDAFRDIFARERTGVHVRAGHEAPFPAPRTERQALLNELVRGTIGYWDDNIFDALTHASVIEFLRSGSRPPLLFVGYGETDEWAHERRYDLYLQSAHNVDSLVAELWHVMQAMPEYRGKTTFIMLADHGRGATARNWTDHGRSVDGADQIWMAVWGRGVRRAGEVRDAVTQSQVAATVLQALGWDWQALPRAAPPLPGVSR